MKSIGLESLAGSFTQDFTIFTQMLKDGKNEFSVSNKFFKFDKLKFNSSIMKEHKNNNFSKGKNFNYEVNEFARNFDYQK